MIIKTLSINSTKTLSINSTREVIDGISRDYQSYSDKYDIGNSCLKFVKRFLITIWWYIPQCMEMKPL